MRGYTTQDKISYWVFGDRIPVTKLLIVSNVVTFIAILLFKLGVILNLLGFVAALALIKPWSFVTYPLVGILDPIGLLFSAYWLWVAGGSLERTWGSTKFAIYYILMAGISALGLFAGALLIHAGGVTANPWLPLAGATVAFAMMNPEQQILFFFVIPMKLKYLALIDAALVLITYGMTSPILGVFALAGCAFSYWYIRPGALAWLTERNARDDRVVRVHPRRSIMQSLNPFNKMKEKRERDRLRKLFEQSGMDDNDKDH